MNGATPLSEALSISDKAAANFAKAGVETLAHAWFYLPRRYENRAQITPISGFSDGATVQTVAQVVNAEVIARRKRMLVVTLRDEAGALCRLRFFRFYPNQLRQFSEGRRGIFYGKAVASDYGYELHHPEIQWLAEGEQPVLPEGYTPIYPTIKGISQKQWRNLIDKALTLAEQCLPRKDALSEQGLPDLLSALTALHQPDVTMTLADLSDPRHPAHKRLITEELCAHRLSVLHARAQLRSKVAAKLPADDRLQNTLLEQLPFKMTSAQQRVSAEIAADLARDVPMMRLVQGDVGSGKTLVALLACLQCVTAGYQAVLMAPTELLAEQHATNLTRLLGDLPISVGLLVSKTPAAEKKARLAAIANGELQIIVGTHALFQQQVSYHALGLLVIDEQHRFGVHQRLALQQKSHEQHAAHQLVLTATPIPRTLAMSQYGELDVSVIDALPTGRKPITTAVISNTKRSDVIARVGAVCREGQQAYWVCPLIEESEVIECENAEATAAQLQAELPDIRVALLHGRMNSQQRQEVMADFVAGNVQLLVATTVIEVGVDVGNATLMIIENAERFGLAQLHQLRGRVGRSDLASFCLLMYQAPLGEIAKRRLNIMRESNDGFVIAEEDLNIRGAGELLGVRQTGDALFRIADLERDQDLLPSVHRLCDSWQQTQHPIINELLNRWLSGREQYLRA
ncbi:ATP-dependent DNA helicase RecG [Suttonella sp. R2A3]|uniref:ATP-dependent DNA helicase RecG n=1 Tax=Suttonella sp. R2A3 TaxID=2908648 RepID=UPI001F2977F5|nr:ATP-dependent DNA helicase RecG [Suttonella sp. R2A3]UJF24313.1 ATP-dependent DNA helicase RecG [Suttonella sp. R2A3]